MKWTERREMSRTAAQEIAFWPQTTKTTGFWWLRTTLTPRKEVISFPCVDIFVSNRVCQLPVSRFHILHLQPRRIMRMDVAASNITSTDGFQVILGSCSSNNYSLHHTIPNDVTSNLHAWLSSLVSGMNNHPWIIVRGKWMIPCDIYRSLQIL